MIIFYNQFRATQSILENREGMKKFQKNPLSLRSWATVLLGCCRVRQNRWRWSDAGNPEWRRQRWWKGLKRADAAV
jgi:hypothetical protein